MKKHLFMLSIALFLPCWAFSQSNLTPTPALETNPLAQKFSPSSKRANTQLYVTQFINPAYSRPSNTGASIGNVSSWVNDPSQLLNNFQLLSNDIRNQYGVGMEFGF